MGTPEFQPGHVGVNVTDLDRSVDFYRRVFGFDVLRESTDADRRYAFLGADGTLLITLWQQSAGRFAADRPGLHHLAFRVADAAAVRSVEQTLRQLGVTPREDVAEPDVSGKVFFADPDGTRLEVYTTEAPPAPPDTAPTCGFF